MMIRQKQPTVTVAVCAFNEERNIQAWLESALAQRGEDFLIERVLIVSDGSTDATGQIARSSNLPKVEVREYPRRLGKSTRLNQIYASLATDILVQSDADVVFAHSRVVCDLIRPLLTSESVAMCGGNPLPVEAETFTEKAVNCTCEVFVRLRHSVRGGNNIFSADGRLLAYRRAFVQSIQVPHDMIANDAFTYFCCITKGHRYRYVPSAAVHFRSPQTLAEQIKQNTRFAAAPIRMCRYFPERIVQREYAVPANQWLPSILRQWFSHPLLCSYIFAVNWYCKLKARLVEKRLGAQWVIASTTKLLSSESTL